MRGRRTSGALAAVLALTGLVAVAAPAQATHIGCGALITKSTTLHNDIGPCTGDGLVVLGNSKLLVLDLNGHTVSGDHSAATATTPEHVGISVRGSSRVTVRNGTVRGFEAGVAIMGGSRNTVSRLTVHDNVNALRPDPLLPGDPVPECTFGDGIMVLNSKSNTISANVVTRNGPFSGISLVGDSDANVVNGNDVFNNNVSNVRSDGTTGPCGRAHQDIGIRVEGPGADQNLVQSNRVTGNQLYGITIHAYVCNPPPDEQGNPVPPEPPNSANTVKANTVTNNGYADVNEFGDGIAILQQGPADVVCVAFGNAIVENTSTGNAQDGIFVGGRATHHNTVSRNIVDGNGRDGIRVSAVAAGAEGAGYNTLSDNRGSGNGKNPLILGSKFDGHDLNANCGTNIWSANQFTTFDPACVMNP